MSVRRARARPGSFRRVRRLLTVLFLLAVVGTALSGPPTPLLDTAAVSVAETAPARVELSPLSAEAEALLAAVPTDPVGRLPAVGLTPRSTAAPSTTPAAPSTSAGPTAPSAEAPRPSVVAVPPPAAGEVARSAGATLPLEVDPPGTQVVTVAAASSSATSAQLTAWERGPDGWTVVLGPVTARVGSAGVGRASEASTKTPAGAFGLTQAFGRSGDPGTALPYQLVDGDDWWVSDTASPRYNTYAQCAPHSCDFNEAAGENLLRSDGAYDQGVVIDYNRGGTPGAGSAFFLHVANGAATAGCVAIDLASLQAIMRWLDPGASPVISIGVA